MKFFVDYFKDSAIAYPTKTTAVYNEQAITYGELDLLSGRIAAYVKQHGVGVDDIVPIFCHGA